VSYAGLVPIIALAEQSGLLELADEHLSVPTDKGANAGRKIGSMVAGMIAATLAPVGRLRSASTGSSDAAGIHPRNDDDAPRTVPKPQHLHVLVGGTNTGLSLHD
jgi:hypothetical protein